MWWENDHSRPKHDGKYHQIMIPNMLRKIIGKHGGKRQRDLTTKKKPKRVRGKPKNRKGPKERKRTKNSQQRKSFENVPKLVRFWMGVLL